MADIACIGYEDREREGERETSLSQGPQCESNCFYHRSLNIFAIALVIEELNNA